MYNLESTRPDTLSLKYSPEFITQQSINFESFLANPELINTIRTLCDKEKILESISSIFEEYLKDGGYKFLGAQILYLLTHTMDIQYKFEETIDKTSILSSPVPTFELLVLRVIKNNNKFYNKDNAFRSSEMLEIQQDQLNALGSIDKKIAITLKTHNNNNFLYYFIFLTIVISEDIYLIYDPTYNDLIVTDGYGFKQAISAPGVIAINFYHPIIKNIDVIEQLVSAYSADNINRISDICRTYLMDSNVSSFQIEKKKDNFIISKTIRVSPNDITIDNELTKEVGYGDQTRVWHNHLIKNKEITIRKKVARRLNKTTEEDFLNF